MKSFEHVYRLHGLLKRSRYPVPFERVREELECSTATTKRVLAYLRDQLCAPLETSRDPRGYRYTDAAYELPGIWFNAAELQALLSLQSLLQQFQPGFLDQALGPLKEQLNSILKRQGLSADNLGRIRLLKQAARMVGPCFTQVADAVLQRRMLDITYTARSTGIATQRQVSPQRLVHYRDNWYLDTWCHRSNGLRTFALDCIEKATAQKKRAKAVPDKLLDKELGSSFGIFSGVPTNMAVLRFSPERARWVSAEHWHPKQISKKLSDGSYELSVPYHHDEELIMDITRHGSDVEVLAPKALRDKVAACHRKAAAQYQNQ